MIPAYCSSKVGRQWWVSGWSGFRLEKAARQVLLSGHWLAVGQGWHFRVRVYYRARVGWRTRRRRVKRKIVIALLLLKLTIYNWGFIIVVSCVCFLAQIFIYLDQKYY